MEEFVWGVVVGIIVACFVFILAMDSRDNFDLEIMQLQKARDVCVLRNAGKPIEYNSYSVLCQDGNVYTTEV